MTELGLQLRVETHPPGGIWLELLFLSSCHGPPDNQIPLLQEVRWWSTLSRVGVEGVWEQRVMQEAASDLPPLAYSMTR